MLKKPKGKKGKKPGPGVPARLTRKEKRKQERQVKKQRKQEHFHKFVSNKKSRKNKESGRFVRAPQEPKAKDPKHEYQKKAASPSKSLGDKMQDEILSLKKQQMELEESMKKERRKQLVEENEEEEKNIRKLEKLMKLNKRKSKSVPKSFAEAGLDYILDVCDSSKLQAAIQAEKNLLESASEFEEDLALVTGKGQAKKKKLVKTRKDNNKRPSQSSDSDEEYGSGDSDLDDESDDAPDEFSSKKGNTPLTKTKQEPLRKSDSLSSLENDLQGDDDSEEDDDMNEEFDSDFDESAESEEESTKPHNLKKSKESHIGAKRKLVENSDSKTNKKVKFDVSMSDGDDDDFGSGDSDGFGEDDESESGDAGGVDEDEAEAQKEVHEDIYGRLRDKHGNIIKESTQRYVPPHLRNQPVDDKKKAELEKLSKTFKGLLNRLAENNMHSIANQIDELYMKHSRFDMNNTLIKQYLDSLVAPVLTPERLIMEHAMLIAVLHANVGSEVGAFFLQHLGKRFDEIHGGPVEIENKELDNLILLLCHMYTFKIFDSVLLYDILERLADKFTPKDVDLILVVLRSVGFSLRKDNPLALKNFIHKVQKLANNAEDMKKDARVGFMLDVLLAIKNNNMSKIPQYNTTHSEHLKKIIKAMFRTGNYVTELKITLEELLKADERGKWWVVGSAWSGPAPQHDKSNTPAAITGANKFTQEILELAKKHRMNTATRKNIFCILMTAEDYLDAFEKLLRLGLRGQPEQDIVHVLIHCLLSEKAYNPYYSHIADQLCTSDRRHRMTIQYAVWDRFKELKTHSNHQIANLAKFLAHLFIQNSLPLSTLKTLEFTEMDKPCVRLLRQILLSLLLHDDREAMLAVFSRVAKPAKLQVFRESVRLFMHHFLLKNVKNDETPEAVKLKEALVSAEQALMVYSDMR